MQLRSRTVLATRRSTLLPLLALALSGSAFGQLLFVPDYGTDKISVFTTNTTSPTGKLSGPSCATFTNTPSNPGNLFPQGQTTGSQPTGLAVTPNGEFVYTANSGSPGSISILRVTASPGCVGSLTLVNTISRPGNPYGVAVDPSGSYLYVANAGLNAVSAFTIDPASGNLTLIGTPYSTGTGSGPNPIVTAQVGGKEFVYVGLASYTANNVLAFQVGAGGTLSQIGSATVNSGTGSPAGMAISGTTLFVTDNNASSGTNGLTAFPINGDGTLGTAATYNTGAKPFGIAVDSAGTYLYVADQTDGTVKAYTLSNLSATPVTQSGLIEPYGVTSDPATAAVYVSDYDGNQIYAYTQGLASAISGSPFTTGTGSNPGQFLLAHIPPAPESSVPAASFPSLTLLAIVLAGCGAWMVRKAIHPSSAK